MIRDGAYTVSGRPARKIPDSGQYAVCAGLASCCHFLSKTALSSDARNLTMVPKVSMAVPIPISENPAPSKKDFHTMIPGQYQVVRWSGRVTLAPTCEM